MKVLVTGGAGFIGSNFIIKMLKLGMFSILNIDKLTYAGNSDNLLSIEDYSNYKFINGDICDISLIRNTINSFQPDAVINFAAETHVDRSIDSPIDFINSNVVGTATLLIESFNFLQKKKNDNFRFLHISTDEVYGSLGQEGFFTESTPYNPSSPYSSSKASSDHLVRAWFHTYELPTLITNCSNNYGPYQFPEKLVPLIIINCLSEKRLPVYGKGLNVRDWLFVDDHCEAILTVLKKGNIGETYNIGGNNEMKNIDVVNQVCSILDDIKPRKNNESYKKLIQFVDDRPGHDLRYAIDSSKINNNLGWEPKESFESGIFKTIKWYMKNENWWKKIQKNNYSQERLGLKK